MTTFSSSDQLSNYLQSQIMHPLKVKYTRLNNFHLNFKKCLITMNTLTYLLNMLKRIKMIYASRSQYIIEGRRRLKLQYFLPYGLEIFGHRDTIVYVQE